MNEILSYVARWLHIASAITLLGGMIFAAAAWLPAMNSVSESQRQQVSDAIASRFRPWFILAMAGLLGSGFYNYLAKKGMPPAYHMLFGMKFLLALHVFAVGVLALRRNNAKRSRQTTGVVISGLIIVAISAWLRHMSLDALVSK